LQEFGVLAGFLRKREGIFVGLDIFDVSEKAQGF